LILNLHIKKGRCRGLVVRIKAGAVGAEWMAKAVWAEAAHETGSDRVVGDLVISNQWKKK